MKMSKRHAVLKQNRHGKQINEDNLNNKSTNVMVTNITNRLSKKMIVSLSLILVMIFVVTFVTSYAFFTTSVKGKEFVVYTGNLVVDYEKKTDVINLNNLYPMTDQQGLELTPHEFNIKNNGNIKARYQVRLELDNSLKDMISPEYIKISYSIDGSSYSDPVLLSNLDTSLAFIRNKILEPTKSNTIGVKLWIDLSAPNEIQGKEFKARIVVDSIQDVEEGYVVDTVPIIYLNKDDSGNQDMIITTNGSYTELGVNRILDDKQVFTPNEVTTTYEYYDGVTTTTVSNIDTSKVGIYYVTYSITDSENNVGKAVRVVAVGDDTSLKIYHDIDSVVSSFDQSSLKEVIMCSYIDGNDRLYFDCKIHDTIENALSSKTKGAVIVTSDISRDNTITINSDKEFVLELNGKTIAYNPESDIATIINKGILVINDSKETGTISTTYRVVSNFNLLTVNNGNFIRKNDASASGGVIGNNGTNSTSIINDGYFETDSTYALYIGGENSKMIINNANVKSVNSYAVAIFKGNGTIDINGGVFVSENSSAIAINAQAAGTININQIGKSLYITSLSKVWNPAVRNNSIGIINIKGIEANQCTNNSADTTSGLCIYAEGDKNYSSGTANQAVVNVGDGIINISGGSLYGGHNAIQNHYGGTVNITGGNISSNNVAVANSRTGNINICSAKINSPYIDLLSNETTTTGLINYSSNVIFTSGDNTPTIGGITANIVPNYTGTCISQ